ncbi:MAG: hypothetical protein AB7U29_10810 [Desulfobulbus sp.]
MKQILSIKEPAGFNRDFEYFEFSIPCAQGKLHPTEHIHLVDHNGQSRPVQVKALTFWHDGSVKWLHGVGCADVPAHATVDCSLETVSPLPQPAHQIHLVQQTDAWEIRTGTAVFTLPTSRFFPFSSVHCEHDQAVCLKTSLCTLLDQENKELAPIISTLHWEEKGPLRATVFIAGSFQPSDKANFSCRIHFYAGKSFVKISFTLHNPKAAKHPGGVWDLGEANSLLFHGLGFSFEYDLQTGSETRYSLTPETPFATLQDLSHWAIYQESSGGEQWQSPVHRNREGVVPFIHRGFIVEEGGQITATGQRATPIVWTGSNHSGFSACLPLFWQEFPKELAVKDQELIVSLFPARFPDLHELQPGEQKTHTFFVDLSNNHEQLNCARTPLEIVFPATTYVESGIFTDLPGKEDLVDQFTSIEELLAKREPIDEYGWRNFGDIFADHEAVNHQGDHPFISHYNNQYDLIAGAYRKFFITGNPLWRQFAAEMAQHVLDIDIYHASADREEYNHGLFWHTEHYSDAGLSTHRSYSKEQNKTYDLYAGGGGPGAEHCYTTGLLIHYLQTGNPDFKQAVLDLANWELLALSGPQTVFAAVKRCIDNLKFLHIQAEKKRLFPHYPLTRGTGNTITACLDAYEVCQDQQWLTMIESIIHGTLHPHDDISSRDLLNAEIGWSYTVLLVAVIKYLAKKSQLAQYDTSFYYARQSFLVYASWMAEHEYPYLEKPEILEYPNETWAAQDLRKSVIFYLASMYATSEAQRTTFCRHAHFFYTYASQELNLHESSRLTRPVTLMLQNGWIGQQIGAPPPLLQHTENDSKITKKNIPLLTMVSILMRFARDIGTVLRCTNLRRELAWLQARFDYFGNKGN